MTDKRHVKTIIDHFWLKNMRMLYNPIVNIFFLFIVFCISSPILYTVPQHFLLLLVYAFIYHHLTCEWQFFLNIQYVRKLREWFPCIRIFTVAYRPGEIGFVSVNTSGMDIIAAPRIALYCCWSSHLTVNLYNLLMFLQTSMCIQRTVT